MSDARSHPTKETAFTSITSLVQCQYFVTWHLCCSTFTDSTNNKACLITPGNLHSSTHTPIQPILPQRSAISLLPYKQPQPNSQNRPPSMRENWSAWTCSHSNMAKSKRRIRNPVKPNKFAPDSKCFRTRENCWKPPSGDTTHFTNRRHRFFRSLLRFSVACVMPPNTIHVCNQFSSKSRQAEFRFRISPTGFAIMRTKSMLILKNWSAHRHVWPNWNASIENTGPTCWNTSRK